MKETTKAIDAIEATISFRGDGNATKRRRLNTDDGDEKDGEMRF
jgi:hypothetical protein